MLVFCATAAEEIRSVITASAKIRLMLLLRLGGVGRTLARKFVLIAGNDTRSCAPPSRRCRKARVVRAFPPASRQTLMPESASADGTLYPDKGEEGEKE